MLSARPSADPLPGILLVDDPRLVALYSRLLCQRFDVRTASTPGDALASARQRWPAVVLLELSIAGQDGLQVCRELKSARPATPVLVATSDVSRVPDAIDAGCDSVLLKPFAPNLLIARLGRLLRDAGLSPAAAALSAPHLRQRERLVDRRTNQLWPDVACPACRHTGVFSFDFTSYRQAWYACLACRNVWVGARREKLPT